MPNRAFRPCQAVLAARGPREGEIERCGGLLEGGRILQALVEHHHDVRTEILLDPHRQLRREKAARAVEVRAERDALRRERAQLAEAEDLEAPAVGEDRAVPVHEAMEPAEIAHQPLAGAQVQVVGVGEDGLRAEVADLVGGDGFDGAVRADREKCRGVESAVGSVNAPAARAGRAAGEQFEAKIGHGILLNGSASRRRSCRNGSSGGSPRRTPRAAAPGRRRRRPARAGSISAGGSW